MRCCKNNGKNAESTDGELHEHGETPNSMDGDIISCNNK